MYKRGVTRPVHQENQEKHDHKGNGSMSYGNRLEMLHRHHSQTLWIYWTILILGIWLVMSPLTFSYAVGTVEPSGGRELWLSLEARIAIAKWNDILCGLLLLFFGWRSLLPNRPVSLWVCCFIGIWLTAVPVLFWSPNAVAYMNATIVGALLIGLSILIPGMPNMMMYMKMGSEVPPGWSYNPSSWPQRWIMIVTGFLGWIVSRYLAAFQMGFITEAWDPFFGKSTELVLNSNMSHSLPVSDAALGSLAYTFEFLMGWMGSPSRWRTMPWMVTFFGILVIPLGLVHIFLVISQPIVVGEWCTFCLLAAAIMLPMIPLEIDEVFAMGQHMAQAKRKGEGLWKVFWKGGEPMEKNEDKRSPSLMSLPKQTGPVLKASVWGMSVPWTLAVSTIIGIFLVAIPEALGENIQSTISDLNHLCGSLIVVVSVICMAEVVRTGRFLNLLLGLGLIIGPFLMEAPLSLIIIDVIAGVAAITLSIPKGKITEQYGLWNKYIK